jgi:hypothetical protein
MKKLIVLLTGLLIVSCSNDNDTVYPVEKTVLASIKIVTDYGYGNNNPPPKMLQFENEKLITIQYNGSYIFDRYIYNDQGLVSKILEYRLYGVLFMTTSFLYDAQGRIIEFDRVSGPENINPVNRKYTFTHLSDKIIFTASDESNETSTRELYFNSNNEIAKETLPPSNFYFKYSYTNGNLVDRSVFNNDTFNGTFSSYTYSNLKNDYDYRKYIFGKEWKLNSYLSSYYTYNLHDLTVLSENLISEYTDNYDSTDVTKFSYSFDDKNNIKAQTQKYTSTINGIIVSSITTEYSYKYTYTTE